MITTVHKNLKTPKGSLTLRALQILEHTACSIGDIFLVFALPYTTSLDKMLWELERRQMHRGDWAEKIHVKMEERRRIYNLLHRLRQDGLIEKQATDRYKITARGKRLYEKLLKRAPLPQTAYNSQDGKEVIIITFDIPEHERIKRDWLRAALIEIGFTMLQRSVWIGKKKLPPEFLEDLKSLKLLQYLHIFTVSRAGSLHDAL